MVFGYGLVSVSCQPGDAVEVVKDGIAMAGILKALLFL